MDPLRERIAGLLSPHERVCFLAVLFRMARADEVSIYERDRLQPVAGWLRATTDELEQAMQRADDLTQGLRDLVTAVNGPRKGILLFREVCAVAWVDGRKSSAEEELLDIIFSALGLTDATRDILDSPLACSPEGERRFLELVGGTSSEQTEES